MIIKYLYNEEYFYASATVRTVLEAFCFWAVCAIICDHILKICKHNIFKLLVGIPPNLQLKCSCGQR